MKQLQLNSCEMGDKSRRTCRRNSRRLQQLTLVTVAMFCCLLTLTEQAQPPKDSSKNGITRQQQQLPATTATKSRHHGLSSSSSASGVATSSSTLSPVVAPAVGDVSMATAAAADNDGGVCELEINCQLLDGNMTQPIRLPFRGPRGPKGHHGQKGDRGDVGRPGPPGRPGEPAPVIRGVAFFVGLMENLGPIASHADIVFDGIVTNVGGGYDRQTGRFNAPVNGTYQFNIVVAAQGRQRAAVMVLKNGAQVITVWAESIPYWSTSANVVILTLAKDDQVWLVLLNKASFLHGYMYTTFSGFLIF